MQRWSPLTKLCCLMRMTIHVSLEAMCGFHEIVLMDQEEKNQISLVRRLFLTQNTEARRFLQAHSYQSQRLLLLVFHKSHGTDLMNNA